MSNPWDFTAVPNTDKIEQYVECEGQFFNAVDGDFARNLERRLRHAEKLLAGVISGCEDCNNDSIALAMAHLEAAKAEDNA